VAEHARRKAAVVFHCADGLPLLAAAGLWDEWKDRQTGERLKSCTMIITEPNDFAVEIHDRMPVFSGAIRAGAESREADAGILKPVPNNCDAGQYRSGSTVRRLMRTIPQRKAKLVRRTVVAVALTSVVVAMVLLVILLWPLGRLPWP
jgi:SOS response associated peptidase (SRAP)